MIGRFLCQEKGHGTISYYSLQNPRPKPLILLSRTQVFYHSNMTNTFVMSFRSHRNRANRSPLSSGMLLRSVVMKLEELEAVLYRQLTAPPAPLPLTLSCLPARPRKTTGNVSEIIRQKIFQKVFRV